MEEILNVQSRPVVLKLGWASDSLVKRKLEIFQFNCDNSNKYWNLRTIHTGVKLHLVIHAPTYFLKDF